MTTQTATLTGFLLARLREWEEAARAVIDGHEMWGWESYTESAGMYDSPAAEFAARHDPAHVLAQCAALRQTVEMAAQQAAMCPPDDWPESGDMSAAAVADSGRWYLRALATIWRDHPDYRADWA